MTERNNLRIAWTFLLSLKPYWVWVSVALLLGFAAILFEALAFVAIVPLFELISGTGIIGSDRAIFSAIRAIYGALGIPYTSEAILAGMAVLFLLKGVVSIGSSVMLTSITARYGRDLRDRLLDSLCVAKLEFVHQKKSGDVLNAQVGLAGTAASTVQQLLFYVTQVFAVGIYVGFAFAVSPLGTLFLAVAVAITGAVAAFVFRRTNRWVARMIGVSSDLYQKYNEFVIGYALIRATGTDGIVRRQIRQQTEESRKYSVRLGVTQALFASALEPGTAVAIGVVLVLQALGNFALSSLGVVGLLLLRSFQRVYGLITGMGGLIQGMPAIKALQEWQAALDANVEPVGGNSVGGFDSLEFNGVSYHYPTGPDVVENLNMRIEKGEFVGIVGASGAGKTTLVGLIIGLLRPTKGQIRLNGATFDSLDAQQWRARLGYVTQDVILFTGTIQENISMWSDDISVDEVKRAALVAQASGFIEALPAKYESLVGERGVNFSGGQKQRLALARAIARKPDILLLDEATSSLDSIAEREFQEALEKARRGFTVIAVAHRLSTVMSADRIIVMDGGKIVESGTPADLRAIPDGKFRALYDLQVAGAFSPGENGSATLSK